MKRPAVFFDRDNTLIVGNDYLGDPEQVVLMQGAADAVSRARALGYATVVVSNQSGVARGMFAEEDVRAVNSRLEESLLERNPNAVIDRHEFCPYHPEATVEKYRRDSDLRKPSPGMILKAAQLLALDLNRSWLIGDAPRDILAGRAAGCRTILFQPVGVQQSPAAMEQTEAIADHVCSTLMDAIDYIAEQNGNEPTVKEASPAMLLPAPDAAPDVVSILAREIAPAKSAEAPSLNRLERLGEQILQELKRDHQHQTDFSISKLFAGITQILAIAVLFVSYLNRGSDAVMFPLLFTAIFIQLLTIALLIMDRQR